MSEGNNLAKNGLEKFLYFNFAFGLINEGYGFILDGKIYSAGAKNVLELAQGGLELGAALTTLSWGSKMIFNSKGPLANETCRKL